jgi:hypothetical protein
MRSLRRIAFVLVLWAVAATVYIELPSWSHTSSSALTEMPKRKRERFEEMIAWAGTAAVACLVLASLIGLGKRMRPAESGQPSGATAPPDAGQADDPPLASDDLTAQR